MDIRKQVRTQFLGAKQDPKKAAEEALLASCKTKPNGKLPQPSKISDRGPANVC